MLDPESKRDYKGTDGTVGFVYAWTSKVKNVGKGEQEIIKIKEHEEIDLAVRFEKPFKSVSNTYMKTENAGKNHTKVKWI